jgi:hypothetical protein
MVYARLRGCDIRELSFTSGLPIPILGVCNTHLLAPRSSRRPICLSIELFPEEGFHILITTTGACILTVCKGLPCASRCRGAVLGYAFLLRKLNVSWGSYLGVEGGGSGKTRGLSFCWGCRARDGNYSERALGICGPIYEAAAAKSHQKITTILDMRIKATRTLYLFNFNSL